MKLLRTALATVAFVSVLASARSSFADDGDYVTRTVTRPNRTLASTGIGVFALGYGPSAVVAAVSDREADKNLFIPVVGPWLDLADRDCGDNSCGNQEDLEKAMLITSGVVQGAGLLLALGSLVIPESSTRVEKRARVDSGPRVTIVPTSYARGAGISTSVRF